MKIFFKSLSIIFHPILIPIGGTIAYFFITPKFTPVGTRSSIVIPIFILTIIIPVISLMILKNIGLIKNPFETSIKERRYPLYVQIILLVLILLKVIPNSYISELYYFYVGLLGATITTLILLWFNYKISQHILGIAYILMFIINLSVHFEINLTIAISIIIIILGLLYSARLYLKVHTKLELITGLIIGLLSQILTVKHWL